MDNRCLCCNTARVTTRIVDAPGTPGFAFCFPCLADLDGGNYEGMVDRMIANHDDMSYRPGTFLVWMQTYREMAKATDRRPIARHPAPTDTPEQIARAAIASYREFTERYGQSPDDATESAVREVREGLTDDALLAAREAYRYAREKADELYGYDGDDLLVRSYYARQHTAWLKDAASEIAYAHRLTLRQVTGGDGR